MKKKDEKKKDLEALREGLKKTIDWFSKIDMRLYRPPTPNF